MKISVIMPCHNAGPWVREALQSIAAQTYPAHEIIVINDNSTDDSDEQIAVSGVPVKLLHTSFGNAAAARNEGIREATGDWIAFLDADDIWYPHHLEQATNLLSETSDVAYLAHNDQLRYYPDGSTAVLRRSTFPPVTAPTSGLSAMEYFAWWVERAWFCTCTLVVRRDVLLAAGGFDPTQIRRHDIEMFLRVLHGHSWAYNPEAGMLYRFHINPNCVSGNILETSYFTLRALINNQERYRGALVDAAIRTWALKTAKYSVLACSPKETVREWEICSPHLTWLNRLFLDLARRSPTSVKLGRQLKHRLIGAS